MRKLIFITYGSHDNYWEAAKRVTEQAKQMRCFVEFYCLNDDMLKERSEQWRSWSTGLCNQDGPRYKQAAKAFLLKSVIGEVRDSNATIFYCDPGCEFVSNYLARTKLKRLILKYEEKGGVAEQLHYPEYEYTKLELLNILDPNLIYRKTGQFQNTFFVIRADDKGREFAERWVEFIDPNKGLWMDPTNSELQLPGFVSHRRDQSIFSLLWKEFSYGRKNPYWEFGAKFGVLRGLAIPIHTIRNRSGESLLPRYQNSSLLAMLGVILNFLATFNRVFRNVIRLVSQ